MLQKKVKEDLFVVVFLNKYLCSRRNVLAFYRNPEELDWKIMKFFGKSSKFLIVRIIFTSMKCRYSWKYPPLCPL